jgi:hypothetical protein
MNTPIANLEKPHKALGIDLNKAHYPFYGHGDDGQNVAENRNVSKPGGFVALPCLGLHWIRSRILFLYLLLPLPQL